MFASRCDSVNHKTSKSKRLLFNKFQFISNTPNIAMNDG